MDAQVIFQSENVKVFKKAGRLSRSRVVVSFAHWHSAQSIHRAGFGETFFENYKIDCIYVNCVDNSWWQYPEMREAINILASATDCWREVVTYGSSMGGYAAFRFAAALRAKKALAFAPQFSIDRNLAKFETRWGSESNKIVFLGEGSDEFDPKCQYMAVYDPLFKLDAMQVNEYKKMLDVESFYLPMSGHPPTELLSEYGILSEFTLAALDGAVDHVAFRSIQRERREFSPQYWRVLVRRLSERRSWDAMRYAADCFVRTSSDREAALRYLRAIEDGIPVKFDHVRTKKLISV